jgi:tellurite resistance protein TerC
MPDILINVFMGQALWVWLVFFAIVALLLVLDLGLLHKDQHEIGVKESLKMSAGYITIGLLFSLWIWYKMGLDDATDYVTGFLIEKSLSLDNIFVIALIFSSFNIPRKYQHRVLFWGILGVIILRGVMIFALVHKFEWILYFFAGFLVITGIKLLFTKDDENEVDVANNRLIGFLKRHLRLCHELEGQKFFIKMTDPKSGNLAWFGTPLLLALISIETADVIFAVDSVPAIFTITTVPYVIYTSNIFAILGLRALYFALAAIIHRFEYLQTALALVLVFIGSKVFIAEFVLHGKFPAVVSLLVTVALLGGGVVASLIKMRREQQDP